METIQAKVDSMAYGGRGVARLDGRVIFIAGALPGETVKAEITTAKKNFAEATVTEIITASPARCQPACPYAFTNNTRVYCPGCRYQHVSYNDEVAFKQAQLGDLLTRLGKIKNPPCLPPTPSPSETDYRNKLVFHFMAEKLGYFTEDNRSIIDIHSCPLGRQELNALLAGLRKDPALMSSLKDHASITLRYSEKDGAISWQDDQSPGAALTEVTPVGAVSVPRGSFFQINPAVSSMVTERVAEIIRIKKPACLIDLYCGVGVFALAAAKAGIQKIIGVELDTKAIEAAKSNARTLNLESASFIADSASRMLKKLLRQFQPAETLLVLDPPRRGLDKEVVEAICRFKPANLVYVSCAPDTLARDVAVFYQAGYTLEHTQIFDMFPRTPYFETVSALRQG